MAEVHPIEKFSDVKRIRDKLTEWGNIREAEMFWLGCHVGFRVSDFGTLTFEQFAKAKTSITVKEKKTGKNNVIELTEVTSEVVQNLKAWYTREHPHLNPTYLFQATGNRSKSNGKPITADYFRKKLKEVCEAIGLSDNIGTHTCRKTFGYHTYKQTDDIHLVQALFNHKSPHETLAYIGISTQKKREVRRNIRF
jgi:integrase